MFKSFKKKTIHSQSVVDLREYTPKALENIKHIEAVLVAFAELTGLQLLVMWGKTVMCNIVSMVYY